MRSRNGKIINIPDFIKTPPTLAYDNTCKYLAQNYPAPFVNWLLSKYSNNIVVLKTELSAEPITADSLILLQIDNQILHAEFQTLPDYRRPIPFRMLQYSVRLQAEYPDKDIEQVVIFLKRTNSDAVFVDTYSSANTIHRYRVIRMWEQDPAPLLTHPALLPLATLGSSSSPNNLLEQVASQVARIEDVQQQENIAACTFILAGLRFDEPLINQLLTTDIMRESVTYQQILREGRQEGRQEGKKEGELALIIRLLNRRFGAITPQIAERLQLLSIPQLEDLAEVLLDFSAVTDLATWLEQQGL